MDYRSHQQAFLNFSATARKKNGKPVYTRFSKFFNYDKAVKRVLNEGKRKLEGLEKILRREAD